MLVVRLIRTNGLPMLRMVGGAPDPDHSHDAGHTRHIEPVRSDDHAGHDHGQHYP